MRTLQPAVSGSVTVHKVTFSASTCLLHLFEISSANDQNLSKNMLVCLNLWIEVMVLSELMPFGMGSFAELMPFGMGSFPRVCLLAWVLVSLAYALWHG